MWALMLRICGNGIEAFVPEWLVGTTAAYEVIRYINLCLRHLSGHPDEFGFDPGNEFTIFVQLWDRSRSDIRSLAFGRPVEHRHLVELMPDPYFIRSEGYRHLRAAAATGSSLPWEQRAATVVWRGSVTGNGPYSCVQDIPRVKLALICRDLPRTDVGIIGVHSTMHSIFPLPKITEYAEAENLVRDRWRVTDFGRHRYALDIDGHANAWGFLEKLIMRCCVLKVASPYEQWFYPRLQPWIHYVPVSSDLSDLKQRIEWCLDHPTDCEWIAANGAALAASITLASEVVRSCPVLMSVADVHPASAAGSTQSHAASRDDN